MTPRLLSIGDCNTLGVNGFVGHAYPELTAAHLGWAVTNCGTTMSTTREGIYLWRDHRGDDVAVITVQFGLVDSWKTVRYAPYVLYYPGGVWRRFGRRLAKKYKKIARTLGLRRLLGDGNVVPLDEYCANISCILDGEPRVPCILIDTMPNEETFRNPEIQRYNRALDDLCEGRPHCHRLRLYDLFDGRYSALYHDPTHINAEGHELVAGRLTELVARLVGSDA